MVGIVVVVSWLVHGILRLFCAPPTINFLLELLSFIVTWNDAQEMKEKEEEKYFRLNRFEFQCILQTFSVRFSSE